MYSMIEFKRRAAAVAQAIHTLSVLMIKYVASNPQLSEPNVTKRAHYAPRLAISEIENERHWPSAVDPESRHNVSPKQCRISS